MPDQFTAALELARAIMAGKRCDPEGLSTLSAELVRVSEENARLKAQNDELRRRRYKDHADECKRDNDERARGGGIVWSDACQCAFCLQYLAETTFVDPGDGHGIDRSGV